MKQSNFRRASTILSAVLLWPAAAGAFEPTNLTGCVMWLRAGAADIQTNNAEGRVSQWNDLSGNGNHAFQSDSNRQPLYQAEGPGGQPTVFFDKSTSGLFTTNYLNSAYSVFLVARVVDASERGHTWRRILPSRDLNWMLGVHPDAGLFCAYVNGYLNGPSTRYKSFLTFNRTYTLAAVNTAAEQRFFVNGYDLTANPTIKTAPGRLTIGGAGVTSADPSDSLISEVIAYDRGLNALERQEVETYLAARYGVTQEGFDGPVWRGAGTDSLWGNTNNWEQAMPAEPALTFSTNRWLSSTNDLPGLTLNHVLFWEQSGQFSGNPVTLKTDFMSFTVNTVDWGLDTALPEGTHFFSVRSTGRLNLSGVLSGAGGLTMGLGGTYGGTLALACPTNTFTGQALLKCGVTEAVRLANAGEASSLGAATGGNAAVRLGNIGSGNSATLRYVGPEPSVTDRPFVFLRDMAIVNASPAGAGLTFNGGWAAMDASGVGTAYLTLGGTSAGVNTVNGVVANAPGGKNALSVKVTGGVWVFTAPNTYTGGLTVEGGGTLGGAGRVAGSSTLTMSPGAVLAPGDPAVDGGIGRITLSAAPILNGVVFRCQTTAQTNDSVKIETAWTLPGSATVEIEAASPEACPAALRIIEAASLTGSKDLSGWDIVAPCSYHAVAEGNAIVLYKDLPVDAGAWQCSMPIRFGGYAGSSALTNFPALIKLWDGCGNRRFRYRDCLPDGADLLFTGEDGVVLQHEIETWDTNGESHVWVQIPRLVKNTVITAYWKNPAQAADANLFVPTNLPDCALWLHAGAGVETNSSGLVSRWSDQSGNARDAVQATAGYQPRWTNSVVNGRPGLYFEGYGTKDGMTTGWGTSNGTYSVFVAAAYRTNPGYTWHRVIQGANNYNWGIETGSSGNLYSFIPNGAGGDGYNPVANTGIRPASGVPFVAALLGDGTNTLFALNGFGYTPVAKHYGPGTLILGIGGRSPNGWEGHILEVIAYDRALPFEERRQVEQYLSLKYDTLPAHRIPSSGLVQWLRGENAIADVMDGTTPRVNKWECQTDYSMSTYASQTVTNRMPERVSSSFNGKPALRFDAVAGEYDSMKAAFGTLGSAYSVVAVFGTRTPEAAERVVLQGAGATNRLSVTSGLITRRAAGVVSQLVPVQSNCAAIAVMTCDALASRFYVNGVNLTQNGTPVGTWRGGVGTNTMYFGAATGDGALDLPLDGDLAEVLVYDRRISDNERRRIEAYLSDRYAIPVDRSNTRVWSGGFSGVWHFTGTDRLLLADSSPAQNGAALLGQAGPVSESALAGQGLTWGSGTQLGRTCTPPAAAPQTYSVWVKQAASPNAQSLVLAGTNGQPYAALNNAGGKLAVAGTDAAPLAAPFTGAWAQYAVAVNANGSVQAYGNGLPLVTVPDALAASMPTNQPLTFGHAADAADAVKTFSGVLDEVRVESVPRSADWIRAAYMTQAENGLFTSYNRWGSIMMLH